MRTVPIAAVAARSEGLLPCAETVVALAEAAAGQPAGPLRTLLLRDPGALVGALTAVGHDPPHASPWPADAGAAAALLRVLDAAGPPGFADWTHPAAAEVYRFSQAVGAVAGHLAARCHVEADRAEVAGVLSPLGWLARHAGRPPPPDDDPSRITRRMVRRLRLPDWLAKTLLALDLPAELSAATGADRRLLLVVQAAVGLAHAALPGVPLRAGHPADEALALLGVPAEVRSAVPALIEALPVPPGALADAGAGALWRAVRLALTSQHARLAEQAARLEAEAEQLRRHLARLQETEEQRLRDLKLRALAELAAGAGHEINNPLAVISGQAQYLLKTEENLERAHALERIISQSQRIHLLLKDLMLYARPPTPQRKVVNLARIAQDVVRALAELALARGVRIESDTSPRRVSVVGDAALLETAVTALVRNAIEAAPADGWVRVRVASDDAGHAAVVVEDNGPGLLPAQREHLFDPFYSGRSAGRGPGLGLSKVWRIAQLHGGDIHFHSEPGQPTRFTLTLPGTGTPEPPAHRAKTGRRNGRHRPRIKE